MCLSSALSYTLSRTHSPIISVKSNVTVDYTTPLLSILCLTHCSALCAVRACIPLSTTFTPPPFLPVSPPTPKAYPTLPFLCQQYHHFLTLPFPSSPSLSLHFPSSHSQSPLLPLSFCRSTPLFSLSSISICRCVFVQSAQLMEEIPAEEAAPESGERTNHV